jgi:hypothetical protein
MRQNYDFLTPETEETLDGNVKAAAMGLDKTKEAMYQILRCEAADPFAHFDKFAEGLTKGRVSIRRYIQRLECHEQRVTPNHTPSDPSEAFKETVHGHNVLFEQYLAAISDGTLDAAECDKLLDIIAIEKPLIATLETALLAHKVKLENAK